MADDEVRDFVKEIRKQSKSPGDDSYLRRGAVTAVNRTTNKYTVIMGGSTIPDMPAYENVFADVGDSVDILFDDAAPRIIGVMGAIVWHIVGAAGEPAFQNSWIQEADRPTSFGRDALGFVHLRGKCRSGSSNSTVFTLPSGFRPAQTEDFVMMANGLACQLKVTAAGLVQIVGAAAGVPWATISGATFFADGT